MGYDQSILKGAKAAKKLHEDIGTRSRVEELGGRVDVFDAIYKSESDLIFRKLNGLLGAYLNIDDTPGKSPGSGKGPGIGRSSSPGDYCRPL